MLIYFISRFIAWLYGVRSPMNEWDVYDCLVAMSWLETFAESAVIIAIGGVSIFEWFENRVHHKKVKEE